MSHLGADVAAYVDGQLSASAMREAAEHLDGCESCDKAVRQQRLLKSRMSTVASPEPPAALLASLAGLAASPPPRERWWTRLTRSLPYRAGVALVGASVAVVVTAYVVGGTDDRLGDPVVPPYDQYAADFFGPTATPATQASQVITEATMAELDGSGWPCHETLAGDLQRTSGAYTDGVDVIALTYSDGLAKLNLFEQVGRLDHDSLDGFRATRVASSQVWVRDGTPTVVTWDEDGVVYTIVTDVDPGRLERAVAELPQGADEGGVVDRVGGGLDRMTSWLGAA